MMSTALPTTEGKPPDMSPAALPSSQLSRPQRVLACVVCQQRKVKCDRKYPCANCIKSRVQCVLATQVSRRRKRRFPERELLERLRKYEDLLRQNNIKFEPLHKDSAGEKASPSVEGGYDSEDEQPKPAAANWSSPSTTANSERGHGTKNIWHAMSRQFRDPDYNSESSDDAAREVVVKKAWEELFENDDHLLFGSRNTAVDISTLHPEPVQIFRLWQLYLENVDPLLKVTHTPSLQGRIIEAASNVLNIKPNLEALMFSIYCMSVLSLAEDDCQTMFGSSRVDLLTRYQFGCQQALLNSGFLRCSDRDCLTALYLYLVSVRPSTVPLSLSSMLGVAVRIAQRMGIHSESALARCTVLEAEMRRRLWWSLILFDSRIGEMTDFKAATLNPMWDCRIPLNVNDSDFRLEMKEPPQVQGKSTEALFAVVRSELGDVVRHTIHLEFNSPALKSLAKDARLGSIPEGGELVGLEKTIEDKYLKFCDPENPLHFMTIWTTRAYLARCRLMECHFAYSSSSAHPAEAHRDAGISYALSMLECDTKIMTSSLTKQFLWMVNSYFPFIAYIHIAQILKQRPVSDQLEQSWEVMSDNYEAHYNFLPDDDNPIFVLFSKIILQAWETCEATFKQSGKSLVTPRIVLSIRHSLAKLASKTQTIDAKQPNGAMDMGISDFPMQIPMGFESRSMLYGMGGPDSYAVAGLGSYPNIPGLAPLDFDVNQLDLSAMDWDLVNAGGPSGMSLPY